MKPTTQATVPNRPLENGLSRSPRLANYAPDNAGTIHRSFMMMTRKTVPQCTQSCKKVTPQRVYNTACMWCTKTMQKQGKRSGCGGQR